MAYYEDLVYENDKLKCLQCSSYIDDENSEIEAHILGANHRDKKVSRFLIRNSIVIKGNSFYCHVCDKSMAGSKLKEHILSPVHEKVTQQIRESVKNDGQFLKLTDALNEMTINCVLCNCLVSFNFESVTTHINSDKHRRARAIAVQALNGIFSVEESNYLWCKICNVYFENYLQTIFDHVDKNNKHKIEITKLLNLIKDQNITIEKFLMDPKEYQAQCNKCDTVVACNKDNLATHIGGKQHKK